MGRRGLLYNGYREVKQSGRESDDSPPSNAEVKNAGSYNSITPYLFMAWCLIKHWIHLHGVVLT
jgi:hypothetical protein